MSRLDAFMCENGHGALIRDAYAQVFACGKCGYRVSYEDLMRMGINP